MAESEDGVIKEGFLCPICHTDMRSPKNLIAHFEVTHSDEQDILTSLKELFGKAKSRILKLDEKDLESLKTDFTFQRFYIAESEPQEAGQTRSYLDYFRELRGERLDHRTSETNKLIIRLDRLLHAEGSDRKQVAQELVPWLDGTTVTRCPSCAATFNFTRRQHHCRLGGCIMCNNCSAFLTYEEARHLIKPMYSDGKDMGHRDDMETLRICLHCQKMLECRKYIQMSQSVQPMICKLYDQLKLLRNDLQINVDLYKKMFASITSGEATYQLQDAQSVKQTIARQAEKLDIISKQIASIPEDPNNPKAFALQQVIHRTTSMYIKDHLLTLPPLPTPVELEKLKRDNSLQTVEVPSLSRVSIKKVAVTTGWTPENIATEKVPAASEDPIMEQINIVRGYIDQAKKAQRYDEVILLRKNLEMLKATYSQQKTPKNVK